MDKKIFYGDITPNDFAEALAAHFNRGNMRTQVVGDPNNLKVQIASMRNASSGGQTAVTVHLQTVEDGVMIEVGQQAWLGVAASLGQSAIATLMNPWNLLNRLDDIAQDIENLKLVENTWLVIAKVAKAKGSSQQISARLRRFSCEYCHTANKAGEPSCVACGAPLGQMQPTTCFQCGFVLLAREAICPQCGKPVTR
ncbi:MAG: hypothetical protein CVU44_22230 [Chloroflexi bacterium HGW-Chloroflexi-6]|jgi:uncharacterized paraquat-inducible protein A|nr:MAG: hypothetical protein CVU44_22230 [Chloroflexi bacterium HGW-Chloroflexi-6]